MHGLVRLKDVKAQLNVLHDDDDEALKLWIRAAEEAVLSYLGDVGQDPWWDGDLVSGQDVPDRVQAGVTILTGYFYNSPDQDEGGAFTHGRLPFQVTSVLYGMRDPALG